MCFQIRWILVQYAGTAYVFVPAYGLVQLVPVFQICRARESQREHNLKQLEEEKKQNWRSRKSRVVICLIVGGFVLGEQGSSILSTRAFYPIYVDLAICGNGWFWRPKENDNHTCNQQQKSDLKWTWYQKWPRQVSYWPIVYHNLIFCQLLQEVESMAHGLSRWSSLCIGWWK